MLLQVAVQVLVEQAVPLQAVALVLVEQAVLLQVAVQVLVEPLQVAVQELVVLLLLKNLGCLHHLLISSRNKKPQHPRQAKQIRLQVS